MERMNYWEGFAVPARRIRKLIERGEFDEAGVVLKDLEALRPLTGVELVLRGRLVQMGKGEEGALSDAEDAFRQALALDPDHVPAMLELGWYFFSVQDDPSKGLEYFEQALEVIDRLRGAAEEGRDECLAELRERG